MAKSGQEVVFEGWLTKSPPTKRIWRAKWRRRWFSLKHSGEIPNQFILTYYADRNCRKFKGSINLDDCEQVDLGLKLEEKKLKLDHVFDIKTPTRTYYLAADSESEMKSWVNYICKVCGLKATTDDEDIHNTTLDVDFCEEKEEQTVVSNLNNDTPPVSPVSTSPYIPISECITGKSPIFNSQDFKSLINEQMKNFSKSDFDETHSNQTYGVSQRNYLINYVNDIPTTLSSSSNMVNDPRFYDSPRILAPVPNNKKLTSGNTTNSSRVPCLNLNSTTTIHNINNNNNNNSNTNKDKNGGGGGGGGGGGSGDGSLSPLQSPTDTDSAFTDTDDNCCDIVYVKQKFVKPNNMTNNKLPSNDVVAPPRPPKTITVHLPPSSNYMNLSCTTPTALKNDGQEVEEKLVKLTESGKIISDEMYDFPRSHQIETEACRNMLQRRHCYNNAAPVKIEGQIFRYDISPKPSTSSSQIFRYDIDEFQDEPASPLSQTSSTTGYSNLPSPLLTDRDSLQTMNPPPIVNRDLKPKRKLSDSLSSSSNPEPPSPSPRNAPSVDRKLKPTTPLQEAHMRKAFNDDHNKVKSKTGTSPILTHVRKNSSIDETNRNLSMLVSFNRGGWNDEKHIRGLRAAPSPTLPGLTRSYESLLSQNDQEQIYHYLPGKMQYLDLDLDCNPSNFSNNFTNTMPSKTSGANTVYKKVDFEKTQAFNITRNNLEKERKEPQTFLKK